MPISWESFCRMAEQAGISDWLEFVRSEIERQESNSGARILDYGEGAEGEDRYLVLVPGRELLQVSWVWDDAKTVNQNAAACAFTILRACAED